MDIWSIFPVVYSKCLGRWLSTSINVRSGKPCGGTNGWLRVSAVRPDLNTGESYTGNSKVMGRVQSKDKHFTLHPGVQRIFRRKY